jgi:hypothetical protein
MASSSFYGCIHILLLLCILSGGGLLPPDAQGGLSTTTTTFFLVGATDPSSATATTASGTVDSSGYVNTNEGDEAGEENQDVEDDSDDDEDDDEDDEDDDDDDDKISNYREYREHEYRGTDGPFPYFSHDFEFEDDGSGKRKGEKKMLSMGMFILSDYVVAGTNLASYNVKHPQFLLFDDFDIGSMVKGNEIWMQMIKYRNIVDRPTLSWYVDKVARKRWLGERRYPQPTIYYMKYKDEIVPGKTSSTKEEEAAVILQNLPTTHGYCAKPTHMSLSMGNWLVDIDPNSTDVSTDEDHEGNVRFTKVAKRLTSDLAFDPAACADSLAEGLQRGPAKIESWALKMVRPGLVVEELYSDHRDRSLPPNEFCIFVIWGKVYCGVWNSVSDNRYVLGIFYRNKQLVPGCAPEGTTLPDWVPWEKLIAIAESLGRNKDMIRIDMFVGVPRYSPLNTPPQIAVSESEIHPTTIFANPYVADEMARLWVAGYKIGNYKTIPNGEVPKDFRINNNKDVITNTESDDNSKATEQDEDNIVGRDEL